MAPSICNRVLVAPWVKTRRSLPRVPFRCYCPPPLGRSNTAVSYNVHHSVHLHFQVALPPPDQIHAPECDRRMFFLCPGLKRDHRPAWSMSLCALCWRLMGGGLPSQITGCCPKSAAHCRIAPGWKISGGEGQQSTRSIDAVDINPLSDRRGRAAAGSPGLAQRSRSVFSPAQMLKRAIIYAEECFFIH